MRKLNELLLPLCNYCGKLQPWLQKSVSDWLVTRQAIEEYLLLELEIPYVHPNPSAGDTTVQKRTSEQMLSICFEAQ